MNRKLYPCKECGREVPIRSKGLCPSCRQKQKEEQGDTKVSTPIRKFNPKTLEKRKENRKCLDGYFSYHIEILNKRPYSEESRHPIVSPASVNVCHIFPKRIYKSIQCNLDNCVYLTWGEHTRFDKLLDELDFELLEEEFPVAWEKVVERVKKLLPLILEKKKLYIKFVEYLNYDS